MKTIHKPFYRTYLLTQRTQRVIKSQTFWLLFALISLSLVLAIYCNLRFGAINLSHQDISRIFLGKQGGHKATVLLDIRIPRLIAAALVGAALAVSGAIMQGITRNPVADPGLLGINSGAGLALVLAYAFVPHLHYSLIILLSLLGSSLAAALVFGLSYQTGKGYHQLRLVLAGAMVSILLSALGQGITNYFHLANAVIGWQAGGLVGINWQMVTYIAPLILLGLLLAHLLSYQLTILSLSDCQATALGQNTNLISAVFIILVLVLSSAAVAVAGSISFVGLIIPHMIKIFVAKNYRQIIPLSVLLGASFMLWVDFACRNLNPPYETPLSALVSLVGFPCFLWLLRKGGSH
ncbi:putative ferrichrome ABC transporter (permease) [Streptococcus canis]|uniref:Ferrichrome transport system permease protein fhuB n=1 Tax=Streptococcus canis FSL Z3-227 TaxID=482234 RepID=A0AAV3FQ59_STRCB|nr:iron ABC transporter permease [Streptococcus canis]EIQ81240.1 Ferrichrome transport system permease protein fhuB [Streptococcus canis FSL Z3-227]VEE24016.1 ferrichrome transport permease [Streptococcus canis]VTS71751.1 ferrichrome transport permease [Streptococcus canis]GAY69768.1 ferrichrome transport system permease [Streptococcus canis]GEE07459.1 putative ferrichrome ABC transporter, permease [Streptococcus canis]